MSRRIITDFSAYFWNQVQIGAPDECWPWLAAVDRDGYGVVYIPLVAREGLALPRMTKASRVAYALTHGPMAANQVARHRCDHPTCCNPGHILPGTQRQNVADCIQRGRRASRAGERNGRAKLNWEQVDIIRRLYPQIGSYTEIARIYGITETQVRNIIQFKRWRQQP